MHLFRDWQSVFVINLDCCLVPSHRGISHISRGPACPLEYSVELALGAPGLSSKDIQEIHCSTGVVIISVLTVSLIQIMKATIEKD